MDPPKTPTKSNDDLDRTIRFLSDTFSLQLPLRHGLLSPASRSHMERDVGEEKVRCVSQIRFLFFKDRDALQEVIEELGDYARSKVTNWKFKPFQERGTVPQLPLSAISDQILASLEVSDQVVADLLRYLHGLLEDRIWLYKERHSLNSRESFLCAHPAISSKPESTMRPSISETSDLPTTKKLVPNRSVKQKNPSMAKRALKQQSLTDAWQSISKPTADRPKNVVLNESDFHDPKVIKPVDHAASPSQSKPSPGYMNDDDDQAFLGFRTQGSEPGTRNLVVCTTQSDGGASLKQEIGPENEVFYTPPSSPLSTPSFTENILSSRLALLSTESLEGDLSTDISFVKVADVVPVPAPTFQRKRKPVDASESTRKRSSHELDMSTLSQIEPQKGALAATSMPVSVYTPRKALHGKPTSSESNGSNISTYNNSATAPSFYASFDSGASASISFSSVFTEPAPRSNMTSASTSFSSDGAGSLRGMEKDRRFGDTVSNTSVPSRSTSLTLERAQTFAGATISSKANVQSYLDRCLFSNGPLSHQIPASLEGAEMRLRYELTRISLDCNTELSKFNNNGANSSEYASFWQWVLGQDCVKPKAPLRQSSDEAWKNAGERFKDVSMTGDLVFSDRRSEPLLKLSLHPLKIEPSFRYSRRFGNDRFLVLSLPELCAAQMPKYVSQEEELVRNKIIQWLCTAQHTLLGRTWKAFSCKPIRRNKVWKKDMRFGNPLKPNVKINEPSYYVYFFAVSGCDMVPGSDIVARKGEDPQRHTEMSVEALLEWAFPWSRNLKMAYPKCFQRYHLLLSKTQATITFKPFEVIRCDDTTTLTSLPRRLDPGKSVQIKTKGRGSGPGQVPTPGGIVMNDGCARISQSAASEIAEGLNLDYIPCAFQGRIAGGKGVWMVDYTDEKLDGSERCYWIEITDSQWKFEGHEIDDSRPDEDRLTFEVCNWSRPLSSATLNEQLIAVLVDRQRPKSSIEEALHQILEEDLSLRISLLRTAMDEPLALRKWNQENNPVAEDRARFEEVRSLGALPSELGEQINWFLENGFTPQHCSFFMSRMKKAIMVYKERLENRMHIEVAKSTTCIMVADPTGQLNEGEVQLCFSRPFKIRNTKYQEDCLDDIDVLVSRNPAHCPWDIQKVRAVFKPALRKYKDVIVFSCKGKRPLAESLSGGDYDGDTAWVCWEPRLVDNFVNEDPPDTVGGSNIKLLEEFGITRVVQTIGSEELASCADFLHKGFLFSMQPNLLGKITSFWERICYKHNSISFSGAKSLAKLLGLLVDAPKQGYVFTEAAWHTYLRSCPDLPNPKDWPPLPAYKSPRDAVATSHVIDQLLLVKAKAVIEENMTRFHADLKEISKGDDDLARVWKDEYESSSTNVEVRRILNQLILDVRQVNDYWNDNVSGDEESQQKERTFRIVVQNAHTRFSNIMPAPSEDPLVSWWAKEAIRSGANSGWNLLKASEAFYKFSKSAFPWYVAGKHLGELKAKASGGHHLIISPMYLAYKLDKGYIKRIESKRPVLEKVDDRPENDGISE